MNLVMMTHNRQQLQEEDQKVAQLMLKGVSLSHTCLEKLPFLKFNNPLIWILLFKGPSFITSRLLQ
jgi:hypothetical protein